MRIVCIICSPCHRKEVDEPTIPNYQGAIENMKLHTKVACFLLLTVIPNVLGLNCHKCSSTESWEDCSAVSTQLYCTQSDAICYKAHYTTSDGTIQVFGKSCGPESFCDENSNPICKDHLDPSVCNVKCCDDDLCNGSPVAGVSGLAVLSCILVMILFR